MKKRKIIKRVLLVLLLLVLVSCALFYVYLKHIEKQQREIGKRIVKYNRIVEDCVFTIQFLDVSGEAVEKSKKEEIESLVGEYIEQITDFAEYERMYELANTVNLVYVLDYLNEPIPRKLEKHLLSYWREEESCFFISDAPSANDEILSDNSFNYRYLKDTEFSEYAEQILDKMVSVLNTVDSGLREETIREMLLCVGEGNRYKEIENETYNKMILETVNSPDDFVGAERLFLYPIGFDDVLGYKDIDKSIQETFMSLTRYEDFGFTLGEDPFSTMAVLSCYLQNVPKPQENGVYCEVANGLVDEACIRLQEEWLAD